MRLYIIYIQIHIHIQIQIHIHSDKMEQMEQVFQSLYITRIYNGRFLRGAAFNARAKMRLKYAVFLNGTRGTNGTSVPNVPICSKVLKFVSLCSEHIRVNYELNTKKIQYIPMCCAGKISVRKAAKAIRIAPYSVTRLKNRYRKYGDSIFIPPRNRFVAVLRGRE